MEEQSWGHHTAPSEHQDDRMAKGGLGLGTAGMAMAWALAFGPDKGQDHHKSVGAGRYSTARVSGQARRVLRGTFSWGRCRTSQTGSPSSQAASSPARQLRGPGRLGRPGRCPKQRGPRGSRHVHLQGPQPGAQSLCIINRR